MTDLYFEEFGPQDAPTIIFLHGGGAAGWMWDAQVTDLKERYHLLVPDLPEQGRSVSVKPFTHSNAAEEIADLISTRAHGQKAHGVGLSEGAQVLVELLSRAPETLQSALISSALLRPVPGSAVYTEDMLRWLYRFSMAAPLKKWDPWIRLNMKYSAGIPERYFTQFKQSFQEQTEEGFVHLMSALHYRMPQGLERVKVPCLVIAGSKEYSAMKQSGRDLLTAIPGSCGKFVFLGRKASLANEHNWVMTAPELFTTTLLNWIEGRSLPAELLDFDS